MIAEFVFAGMMGLLGGIAAGIFKRKYDQRRIYHKIDEKINNQELDGKKLKMDIKGESVKPSTPPQKEEVVQEIVKEHTPVKVDNPKEALEELDKGNDVILEEENPVMHTPSIPEPPKIENNTAVVQEPEKLDPIDQEIKDIEAQLEELKKKNAKGKDSNS